jgi:transposase
MEELTSNIQTLAMDHHGLVAAVCKDLKIAEKIDAKINKKDKRRVLSTGKSVVAMILNGLGFTNRRLYLTHQFFETKPIEELLFEENLSASDITDYTLGHALDEIGDYSSSQLFGEVAFEVAIENDLLGFLNHLDTTSMSVSGEYSSEKQKKKAKTHKVIEVTHGYSKACRPDLKQVVLSLVVNGPSSIPLFMEPLSGNSSDKTSFHETIVRVKALKEQLNTDKNFKWIADSALYVKDKLLKKEQAYLWVTRVPETIRETKKLLEKEESEVVWTILEKGYKVAPFTSNYGDVEQRWLLVHSEQAYEREKKTLEKRIKKKGKELEKALWHLGNCTFGCERDAKDALRNIEKKYPLHRIQASFFPETKHKKRGRPKAGDEAAIVGVKVKSSYEENIETIMQALNRKGRFILATNDLDEDKYSDQMILNEYKEQQKVERGFRFLKDPWFMVDSIFLKTPKRIEALMMVMTLCLMVYNIAQYKLREALKKEGETIPNQLRKQVQNPTMRWIFQLMEGIGIIQFYDKAKKEVKRLVTNLNQLRKKIIRIFGDTACILYGLNQKSCAEII